MGEVRYGLFGRLKTREEHGWLQANMRSMSAAALSREFTARFGWDPSDFTPQNAHTYAFGRMATPAADDGGPRPQWPDARCEYCRMSAMLREGLTVPEVQAMFVEHIGWKPPEGLVRGHAKGLGMPKPAKRRKRRYPGAKIARLAEAHR